MKEPITPTPIVNNSRLSITGVKSHWQQSLIKLIIFRWTFNLMVTDAMVVHCWIVRFGTTSTDQVTAILCSHTHTHTLLAHSTKAVLIYLVCYQHQSVTFHHHLNIITRDAPIRHCPMSDYLLADNLCQTISRLPINTKKNWFCCLI